MTLSLNLNSLRSKFQDTFIGITISEMTLFKEKWFMKRTKYEIRLGKPNRPLSMDQKKVEPILCVEPLTERRLRLAHHVSDSWRLALQGKDLGCKDKTCPTRRRLALQGEDLLCKERTWAARRRLALQGLDLLYKERRQDLTTIKAPTSSSHKRYAWLTPL